MTTVKTVKNNKGFTLLELILVIALGAVIMAAAIMLYQKARDSAIMDENAKAVQAIMAGLSELRLYTGVLPSGATWPAATNAYVDAKLRAQYGYSCSGGTLTLTTPVLDSNSQASGLLTKFTDQGLCVAGSVVNSTQVACTPTGFQGSAGCP